MEIYLTRMELNTRSRSVWDDLSNPQRLHKTVSSGFPKIGGQDDLPPHERKTPRNQYRLLHRLEFDRYTGKVVLLVQSRVEPDWSSLGEAYAENIESKSLHDKYSEIGNGTRMIFRLQANPTKRDAATRNPEKPKQRKRVDIRKDEDRIEWLHRKGSECGFRVVNSQIKESVLNLASAQQGSVKFRRELNAPKITLGSVVFEGVLEVTDAESFKNALANGVGGGKAYGFGLLSVAPAREI